MFAERQVVLLKEAQQMSQKDLEKLQNYIDNPLKSTVLIVSHKEKKFDGRSALYKVLKAKAELLTTKKMYDNQLPEWTNQMIAQKGLTISPKALTVLVDHIGNDLNRIENEVEKLKVNLGARKGITEDDIETYIGIFIGAITFSGSLIAFGKLNGKIGGRPLLLPGRHWMNLAALVVVVVLKGISRTSCPWDLEVFGGAARYLSHWAWGQLDGGPGGCFPAGHASTGFAFVAAHFWLKPTHPSLARRWMWVALATGALLGISQQMRGAHFMSHTLWTVWLCWSLGAVLWHLTHRK